MKSFTVQLSKEQLHYIQSILPKGNSFVKFEEQKIKNKNFKNNEKIVQELPSLKNHPKKLCRNQVKSRQKSKTFTMRLKPDEKIKMKKQSKKPIWQKKDQKTQANRKQNKQSQVLSKQKKVKQKESHFESSSDKTDSQDSYVYRFQQKSSKKKQMLKKNISKIEASHKIDCQQQSSKNDAKQIKSGSINTDLKSIVQKQNKKDSSLSTKNNEKNVIEEQSHQKQENLADKGKIKKKKSPKKKQKYSVQDRTKIVSRIKVLDRATMREFFKKIGFSQGDCLDFKLLNDEKINQIQAELVVHEQIHKQRVKKESQITQNSKRKLSSDFEIADDPDYDD